MNQISKKEKDMELAAEEIRKNLALVRENIEAACRKAGRNPSEVTLLAVSKKKPTADIRAALEAGQHIFGENYVQELDEKYAELGDAVTWHMIGHLQRNKVKYLIGKAALIHSVDSIALAEQIEKEAAKKNVTIPVLLEVNIAGEDTKWGLSPEETPEAARIIGALPHIEVRGLMTSAPYTEDPESNREYFRGLKALLDRIAASGYPGVRADTLSMGMSGDYAVAVEEGATIVRVGSAIFGER